MNIERMYPSPLSGFLMIPRVSTPIRPTDPLVGAPAAANTLHRTLAFVEIINDYSSTFAMAYLEPDIKRQQCFMMFGYDNGVMGDVTTPWTDENVVPYYKGTSADIRLVDSMEHYQRSVSFKRRRYR